MKESTIAALHSQFEAITNTNDGVEHWFARDLQGRLGYTEWRSFELVIDKAKIACATAGLSVDDHFVDVNKMVAVRAPATRYSATTDHFANVGKMIGIGRTAHCNSQLLTR